MDLYDELDDREKEKDGMILEVGNMKVEIPEELVEERARLMHIDSEEQNISDIQRISERFYCCFKPEELKNSNDFQEKLIDHLNGCLDIFRM